MYGRPNPKMEPSSWSVPLLAASRTRSTSLFWRGAGENDLLSGFASQLTTAPKTLSYANMAKPVAAAKEPEKMMSPAALAAASQTVAALSGSNTDDASDEGARLMGLLQSASKPKQPAAATVTQAQNGEGARLMGLLQGASAKAASPAQSQAAPAPALAATESDHLANLFSKAISSKAMQPSGATAAAPAQNNEGNRLAGLLANATQKAAGRSPAPANGEPVVPRLLTGCWKQFWTCQGATRPCSPLTTPAFTPRCWCGRRFDPLCRARAAVAAAVRAGAARERTAPARITTHHRRQEDRQVDGAPSTEAGRSQGRRPSHGPGAKRRAAVGHAGRVGHDGRDPDHAEPNSQCPAPAPGHSQSEILGVPKPHPSHPVDVPCVSCVYVKGWGVQVRPLAQ